MTDRLLELCALDGTSGDEGTVREYIRQRINADKITVDPLGNLLVFKKGRKTPKNKLMFAAHMDEVGFMVTDITDEGFLRFGAVGGIDPRVLLGRGVRFAGGVKGVVGTKAVHQQSADERKKAPAFDDMLIDIGASTKEQAEKLIERGSCAVFDSDAFCFGDGFVEIELTAKLGGYAVGVATNEKTGDGTDEKKRERLIGAGASLIIPHFSESDKVLKILNIG